MDPDQAVPRLRGSENYKEWSRKMEFQMRVNKLWNTVLSPPERVPQPQGITSNIFVASRTRIYVQSTMAQERRAKEYLWQSMNNDLIMENFTEMSAAKIWRTLERNYGKKEEKEPKMMINRKKSQKKVATQ